MATPSLHDQPFIDTTSSVFYAYANGNVVRVAE